MPGSDFVESMHGSGAFVRALDSFSGWAQRYLDSLETRAVSEPVTPGEILARLPQSPPEEGFGAAGWEALSRDLEEVVEPGLVHWQSPRFFAYFPCGSSVPGVMGELASAVLNVNGMLWSTSPSATELEMRVMDWCAQLFGLPEAFRFDAPGALGGGCIQGTASEGVLAALVAARRRKVRAGRDRSTMTVYTSTQAHSSVVKAAMVAGLADGPEDFSRVRLIEPGGDLGMNPDELRRAIELDLDQGLTPCMVSTTQGTTSTGAMDPLPEIGAMLGQMHQSKRPWLHVDAAWAGAAAVCPEFRDVLGGVESADSLCINPHKWLLTNFDCDLFWVRDREALTGAMSITPAYLRNEQSDAGRVVDYRDWHVPLGRRARALKLWFVIRAFGASGLRDHIRRHVGLAQRFEGYVEGEPRLGLVVERSLSLVCFVVRGSEGATRELVERVNARRRVMISHTVAPIADDSGQKRERYVARVAIGASGVRREDIDVLIGEIDAALGEVVQ